MHTTMSKYANWLTDEEWAALPTKERALLRAAYHCDVEHIHEDAGRENRSAVIDAWEKEAGCALGSPWCGVFVTVNFEDSGAAQHPSNGASTHAWVDWAKQQGRVVKTPSRGDVFVLLFSPTTGHMGHIAEGLPNGDFRTVEGNTNTNGSREGYEVARHTRSPTSVTYFISMDNV